MDIFRKITAALKGRQDGPIPQEREGGDFSPSISVHGSNGKGKAGWVSPVYSRSTTAILDPVTVSENRCVTLLPNSPEIEFYRTLRTRILRRTAEAGGNTFMVTSALPGEGKTLTAVNLAFSFARDYRRTALLVDCDLRQQSVHRYLGTPGEKGLIDYLVGDAELSDLIVWPGVEKVTLISGGRPYPESTELLASPRMAELVGEMKTRYPERLIFFDLPPILSCADALAFAPLVDWVLVVVRSGRTSIADVNRALQLLPREKLMGLVLNGQKNLAPTHGDGPYRRGYGYGYGYGG